jgi:hypothetical protein
MTKPRETPRRRGDDLPADEVDTMRQKAAAVAPERAESVHETPYDPGGLGEINDQPERRNQARSEDAGKGETSGAVRRRR